MRSRSRWHTMAIRWPPRASSREGLFKWNMLVKDGGREALMVEGRRLWGCERGDQQQLKVNKPPNLKIM